MMSVAQSVSEFFDIINKRDLSKLEEALTENARFYFPKTQPLLGKNRIVRFFKILFRQYPELAFKIRRQIVQGPLAAIHWTNYGVNKKQEPYENEGVTILEIKGDKIRFISDFFKDTGKF